MVFKKIIFQKRYVELETPPPFMAKTILNFHFDYWNPSLNLTICTFVLNSLKIQISHRASVLSLVHIVPAIRLGSLGKCPVCASRKVNLIAFLQIPSGSVRVRGSNRFALKFHHGQTCPRAHRASSLGATSPASGRSRSASPARHRLFNNVEVDLCLAHFVHYLTQ